MRVYVLYKGENGKDLDHWGFYTNKESAITDKEYLQSKYPNENIWINDYELETKPFLQEHFNKCEKEGF